MLSMSSNTKALEQNKLKRTKAKHSQSEMLNARSIAKKACRREVYVQ